MKKAICTIAVFAACYQLQAQDTRERSYYFENLEPRHEAKPLVAGFAKERVEERLSRGLVAAAAQDGKSVYLSWVF